LQVNKLRRGWQKLIYGLSTFGTPLNFWETK
jgi:hypothetical protein